MFLSILDFLFTIGGIGVLISVISFISMMIFVKRLNPRIILGMVAIFIVTLSVTFTFPSVARSELREKLTQEIISSTSEEHINNDEIVAALKKISYVLGTNSHSLERFGFKIQTSEEVIYLELARDSNDSKTYWVYYPKYRAGQVNDIGKVRLQ
ncbi:hypothetical protein C9J12_29545 [Photobacterium frigidiphilum]|uniref:Uncharacterized protein n=1 Tax=Photobacterium frigidiphilum TaxID=264736 RepID=A0A2T3J5R4_9GAMM|nr:hypothetical protein [Photobacterium frigidiphilum]PSU41557.1 hypothetical protein C9J12_29545 [Photobacterium frigidiphilum]